MCMVHTTHIGNNLFIDIANIVNHRQVVISAIWADSQAFRSLQDHAYVRPGPWAGTPHLASPFLLGPPAAVLFRARRWGTHCVACSPSVT
jgi:hypothetical protein